MGLKYKKEILKNTLEKSGDRIFTFFDMHILYVNMVVKRSVRNAVNHIIPKWIFADTFFNKSADSLKCQDLEG